MGNDRHDEHGQHDRAERESGDGSPVLPEVALRRVERSVEQYGGDEERERKLRIEHHRRDARQECERRAGNRDQGRVRRGDATCDRREDGAAEQQRDDGLESLAGPQSLSS